MLTPEQQAVAEEAMKIVPSVIRAFMKNMPCIKQVAQHCDLESAAYVACCKAAKTYDKSKGIGISAYFSVAIRNQMLKEVKKELKSNAHSIMRIPLEQIHDREPPKREASPTAMPSLLQLTERERDWVERFVFDGQNRGGSFRAFGREAGMDHRAAKKLLLSVLDRLRSLADDHPGASAGEQ
jgi:DNA-directed RNA polymerase sigma subunit (sigma70/sigma32)